MMEKNTYSEGRNRVERVRPVHVAFCGQGVASSLHDRIAELAYSKAEQRGFEPGHELEDWLEAEVQVREFSL